MIFNIFLFSPLQLRFIFIFTKKIYGYLEDYETRPHYAMFMVIIVNYDVTTHIFVYFVDFV